MQNIVDRTKQPQQKIAYLQLNCIKLLQAKKEQQTRNLFWL